MSRIRKAAVAGRFYPASASECTRILDRLAQPVKVDGIIVAGIVPHAGWVYSGKAAALTWQALAQAKPETVVIFGAEHSLDSNDASMFGGGAWETPLGMLAVDADLARRIAACRLVVDNPGAHQFEHSIEVQLPLVKHFVGDVRILPIGVRPGRRAVDVGRVVAAAARECGRAVVFAGSTDLTHYGPNFGFEPAGRGEVGVAWAKDVNDRRLVERIAAMDANGVLADAAAHRSACGAGAVAATIAAAAEFGATRYIELEHTTSADVEVAEGGQPVNSVGYEAGVFVK